MTRKSAQETQLNEIKSRLAVLKLQVESLTSIKNNYLTGACAFVSTVVNLPKKCDANSEIFQSFRPNLLIRHSQQVRVQQMYILNGNQ